MRKNMQIEPLTRIPTANACRSALYVAHRQSILQVLLAASILLCAPTDRANGQTAKLRFDGLDDYIEVPDQNALSVATTGAFTVSAWINPATLTFSKTEGTGYVHWLAKGEGTGAAGQQEWAFRMYSQGNTEGRANRISFHLFNLDGAASVGSYFEEPVTPGEWIHVVGVADGQRTYVYKDGAAKDCDAYRSTASGTECGIPPSTDKQVTPRNGTAPMRIGTRDFRSFFPGLIRDVRIWNRALSAAEIQRLFAGSVSTVGLVSSTSVTDGGTHDVFQIKKLQPTVDSGPTWDSRHWNNGVARDIIDRDPYDPTNISQQRGNNSRLYVDGQGTLHFFSKGSGLAEPRLYLNDPVGLNNPAGKFFKNVEITAYYQRITDDKTAWGGLVIGARSGPDGHSGTGNSWCDAHTYYARFRHDGNQDFEKELKHPDSLPQHSNPIWQTADTPPRNTTLPTNTWIGMKFIIYNVKGDKNVKMEIYRDKTGGLNGGTWEKIDMIVDAGGWAPAQASPVCSFVRDYIATARGVIIVRDTGTTEARYKWLSAREM